MNVCKKFHSSHRLNKDKLLMNCHQQFTSPWNMSEWTLTVTLIFNSRTASQECNWCVTKWGICDFYTWWGQECFQLAMLEKKKFWLCNSVKLWAEFKEHKRWGAQWWKSRRLVCTRVMPCSLQALMTTASAAEPAGAAMYSTPLYRHTEGRNISDDALKACQYTTVSE